MPALNNSFAECRSDLIGILKQLYFIITQLKLIKGKIADPEEASIGNTDLDYMLRALTRD